MGRQKRTEFYRKSREAYDKIRLFYCPPDEVNQLYTRGKTPPFDTRDLIPGSENDNDHLQTRYDTANRMIVLIGKIPYQRLFTEKWGVVLPEIIGNIGGGSDHSLLSEKSAGSVTDALNLLLSDWSDLSWSIYLAQDYTPTNPPSDDPLDRLYAIFVTLWQQGVYLPFLTGSKTKDARRRVALTNLHTITGMRTYEDTYRRRCPDSPSDWTKAEIAALKPGFDTGIIFDICPNERCCSSALGRCMPGNERDCCVECSDTETPCD